MIRTGIVQTAVMAGFIVLGGAAQAASIAGAGSGSTGGVINGTTNETNGMMETGKPDIPQPAAPQGAPLPANALPDNALMTAPREAKPGTTGQAQPSNLDGQNP